MPISSSNVKGELSTIFCKLFFYVILCAFSFLSFDTSIAQNLTVLIGNQFYENDHKNIFPVLGVAIYPYTGENLKVPVEFLLYKVRWNYKEIVFPRISSALKYYPKVFNSNLLFFQGGLGVPLLFYYPVDFNLSIGINFKKVQIEIREIYYLEVGGQEEINLKHWPMFSILLGVTL